VQRLQVRARPERTLEGTDAAPSAAPRIEPETDAPAGRVSREQVERYVVPEVVTLYVHKGELCNG